MNSKQYFYVVLFLISLMVLSCSNSENKETKKVVETKQKVEKKIEFKKVLSVCIWEKGSVKETPTKKGKYLSAMSLGEKVTWLSKTVVDSSDKNRKYYNIELSDGTQGWASEYVLAIDAGPAIAINDIPIYRRPDLLTLKESSFSKMEFMAVLKKDNGWLQVLGEKKKKKGWIKEDMVSFAEDNVAVGLLSNKALAIEDSLERRKNIEAIINNPSFSNSIFIGDLKEMYSEEI